MTKEEFWVAFAKAAEGLSARQLASKLDVPHSNAYRWKVGTSAPSKISRRFIVDKLERERAEMLKSGEKGAEKDEDGFPIEMTNSLFRGQPDEYGCELSPREDCEP